MSFFELFILTNFTLISQMITFCFTDNYLMISQPSQLMILFSLHKLEQTLFFIWDAN